MAIYLRRGNETIAKFNMENEDVLTAKANNNIQKDQKQELLRARIPNLGKNYYQNNQSQGMRLTIEELQENMRKEDKIKEQQNEVKQVKLSTEYKPQDKIEIKSTFIPPKEENKNPDASTLAAFGLTENDFKENKEESNTDSKEETSTDTMMKKYEQEYSDEEPEVREKIKKNKRMDNF